MSSLLPLIAAIGAAASVLTLIAGLTSGRRSKPSVRARLQMATQRTSALEHELRLPLMERAVRPMVRGLTQVVVNSIPKNSMVSIDRKIVNADMEDRLDAATFATVRWIAAGTLGICAFGLFSLNGMGPFLLLPLSVGLCGLGYMLPFIWLSGKVRQRQEAFRLALPDAIDLITLCLEAMPSFEAAVRRVADKSAPIVGKEFAYMLSLIHVTGLSRSEALQRVVDRVGIDDMRMLATAVAQAELLGTALADVFRRQADDMRMRRRLRAETLARQAPVKMMFPLVLLVFPPLMIVILGPSIPQIIHAVAPELFL